MIDKANYEIATNLILSYLRGNLKNKCPNNFIPKINKNCVSTCTVCKQRKVTEYVSKYKSLHGLTGGVFKILDKLKITRKSCPSDCLCTFDVEGNKDCASCWKTNIRSKFVKEAK